MSSRDQPLPMRAGVGGAVALPGGRRAPAQRGAALIVALVVVALVALLAVTLSGDFLLLFRRVENQQHSEQAYAYLLGAEGVARAGLLQDLREDKVHDHLAEPWAEEQKFPTDYGWITGRLIDLQGRFNLNNLAGGTPRQGGHSLSQERLIRLLQTLALEEPLRPEEAQALTEAITDWIDGDDNVSGLGGAESQYYAEAEPPGRPANRPLASASELMYVRGMTPEIYRALAPLVTVWPVRGGSININTAPPQVLASINTAGQLQPLDKAELDFLLQQRGETYLTSLDAFNAGVLQGRNIDTGELALRSDYFALAAQTEFQGRRYTLNSVLKRDAGRNTVRVVMRSYGEW